MVTNGENPDKSHIPGKTPGQGLKKRTCPGKPGRMATLMIVGPSSSKQSLKRKVGIESSSHCLF